MRHIADEEGIGLVELRRRRQVNRVVPPVAVCRVEAVVGNSPAQAGWQTDGRARRAGNKINFQICRRRRSDNDPRSTRIASHVHLFKWRVRLDGNVIGAVKVLRNRVRHRLGVRRTWRDRPTLGADAQLPDWSADPNRVGAKTDAVRPATARNGRRDGG